jgi:flavin reductase (DIM6/NTAB) family NADH-FMN oxidoreductase RutF
VKALLKRILTGLTIEQEYVCLGYEGFRDPLKVFLTLRGVNSTEEVTYRHIFLGYKPLVIAITFPIESVTDLSEEICLSFSGNDFSINSNWKGFPSSKVSIARLKMKKIEVRKLSNEHVVFYKGLRGDHKFISYPSQFFNSIAQRVKNRTKDNISLEGNLYDQVRIAYSVPRKISLITVCNDDLMNLFPTDLHGFVGEGFYLSSLRIMGRACQQVEQARKIVISEVDSNQFKVAYQLGKNHMKMMVEKNSFEFSGKFSKTFTIPLPVGVLLYRELELLNSFDVGIHRILIYKVVYSEKISELQTLAHIHQYYAQWRNDTGLITQYLLR